MIKMTKIKKNNSGERHVGVLLEAIQTNFKVFGEKKLLHK